MRDVLVIIPSRGRAYRLDKAIEATLSLAVRTTDIAVAWDDDDADGPAYEQLRRKYQDAAGDSLKWHKGPRDTLTGWTNKLAREYQDGYWCLASHGDDHIPRTRWWDSELVSAIAAMSGSGIAYGNDGNQGAILPTAVMVSSDIVKALGWFALPAASHFYIDNAWKDLGEGAGCLTYRQDVLIEHQHPNWGSAPNDMTYHEALSTRWDADGAAYVDWCLRGQRATDIKTVREVCQDSRDRAARETGRRPRTGSA